MKQFLLAFCFISTYIIIGLRICVYGPFTCSHSFYIIKHDIDNNRECPVLAIWFI